MRETNTIAFYRTLCLADPGLSGVDEFHGFEERAVNMSKPMSPQEMANHWTGFIDGHIPNFDKTHCEQIDTCAKKCWTRY